MDSSTTVPGGTQTFSHFTDLDFDGRTVVFLSRGLFVWSRPPGREPAQLRRILTAGDTLDGNIVLWAQICPGMLVGNRMLVNVTFQNAGSGLYVVELPDPTPP